MRSRFLAASALWLLALPALAQQVDDAVVFGDSLSDPGNIPELSGGVNFPPSPPYAGNRFSNGPVYSELLPGLLGGDFDPSLNFSVGGALTGQTNLNSDRPSLLPGSDLSGVVLPGIETQVDGFLAGGGALDGEDVVVVYGGANDIFVAAETAATLPVDQIPALVQSTAATSAGNLATSVVKLNTVGGETFVLPNLPDLGATPSFAAGGADSVTLADSFTLAHNLALGQAAGDLQDQTGAKILVFDINGIFDDIRANPERYGVTNITEACIDVLACVAGDQDTQNQFLFFDGVHPTAGIHAAVAQILAATLQASATVAAQGDVTLDAAEDFQRALIETLYTGGAGASGASVDTADRKTVGEAVDQPSDVFLLVDHTDGDRDARDGALGYDDDLTSVTAGFRHRTTGLLSFGAALRVGDGDADLDDGRSSFGHRQVQLGLSAAHGVQDSYVAAFANVGYAEIRDIERQSGVDQVTAEAKTDGFIYGAGLAGGHHFSLGDHLRFGPEASLRYSAVEFDGYVEKGPDFLRQRVGDQDDIESLVASIGAALELDLDGDDGAPGLILRLAGFLDHDLEDGDRRIETSLVTSPTTLDTEVDGSDRTTGRLGADLGITPVAGITLGVGYETVVGDDDRDQHTISARATLTF
jgi:outer membrane lipase/esterase